MYRPSEESAGGREPVLATAPPWAVENRVAEKRRGGRTSVRPPHRIMAGHPAGS
jgi:hypothetical protein